MNKDFDIFWSFEIEYWFKQLNSSAIGISQSEANEKLKNNSKNKKQKSSFQKDFNLFIRQFKSPLMLLLIGAVILSAFLGDNSDVFIIMFIVLSTGILSFVQERNAGKVVEKLQSLISLKNLIIRDNEVNEINAPNIVTGDIVILKAGDIIPSDCLLIESNELHVNEASLTGESFPVRKQIGILDADTPLARRINCVWQGTNIISGTGKAIVIKTGGDTIFDSIAESATKEIETTFEIGIKEFGFFLMKITLILSSFILIVNLLNHKNIIESALFALALAVGMAPELLPAINTIAMSAGAKRLLSKKVIVKRLSSIQNLGEVDLLCTDKTGTITDGEIIVEHIFDTFENENEYIKRLSYYNAILESGYSNPIDLALREIYTETPNIPDKIAEIPYDFIRKRLSIAIHNDNQKLLICKGAFNQIIEICSLVKNELNEIEPIANQLHKINQLYEKYGLKGFRVIAICYKNIDGNSITIEDEKEMIFGGFILLQDPVKKDIISTIEKLKELQIDLKIITGDNKNVAQSIGEKIGILSPNILTGKELIDISPEALNLKVKETHIFAEVEPQQKERIILALRNSFTVAYMGDGINDVSAINAADIGISVENAVDVAKEAADFVLMEKDLSVLIEGIKEGRKTFANTLKYIFINTGATFGNMFSVAMASLILPFLPMLPKQILLTNFITDFPYLTIASDNVDEEQLQKPGKWNIKVIRKYMIIFGIHSSIFDLITFLVLLYILKVKETAFQTGWFVESILTELFILFIIRTHKNFFKSKPGKYLFILSILGLILTIGIPYTPIAKEVGLIPLPLKNLGFMLLIVFFYIITADILKVWFFKKYQKD